MGKKKGTKKNINPNPKIGLPDTSQQEQGQESLSKPQASSHAPSTSHAPTTLPAPKTLPAPMTLQGAWLKRASSKAQASSTLQATPQPQASSTLQATPQPQASSTLQATPQPQASSTLQATPQPQASSTLQATPQPQASSTLQATPQPQASSKQHEELPIQGAWSQSRDGDRGRGWGRGRGRGRNVALDQSQSQNRGFDQNQGEVKKVAWGRNVQQQQQQQQQQLPMARGPKVDSPSSSSLPPSPLSTLPSTSSTSKSQSQLQEKSAQTVTSQLALSIPKRKQAICGTLGRPIMVEVNVMSFEFKKFVTNVTQYDVNIIPDKPRFLMRRVFEHFRRTNFPSRYPAYDGNKIVYSAQDLPFGERISGSVEIEENGRKREFIVEMSKTVNLDLSFLKKITPGFDDPLNFQSGIQALDVILRHGPLTYNFPVGRSIFWQPRYGGKDLTGGMEAWTGQFQSAILGWKPLLNIDVAHKGFPTSQNVIDVIKQFCSNCDGNISPKIISLNQKKINIYLDKLKVHYEIPNVPTSRRTHIARGLIDESPKTCRFSRSDGTSCTVEEYFRYDKRYIIKYPDWPCLWIGAPEKKIYVPPELCVIVPGQVNRRKLTDRQTSEMIRFAATNTEMRKRKIMDGFNALEMNKHPTLTNEFHLSINPQFEKVPARVLDPPRLSYYGADSIKVNKGTWKAGKMLHPIKLEGHQWAILNLHKTFITYAEINNFMNELESTARRNGMFIGKTNNIKEIQFNREHDLMQYFQHLGEAKIQLVVVIIPDYNEVYCRVKQITELKTNVLTQCVKSVTIKNKCNGTTVGNIVLKINSKLNGTNHSITEIDRPKVLDGSTVVIGADVTHPPPDSEIPSIAAVTASCDKIGFKYSIEVRLQPPRQEIISDLTDIIKKLLKNFCDATKQKPSKIIVYRDGVSDGQISHVLEYELPAFQRAFKLLFPRENYRPLITFLVVQKRHHIRFFPASRSETDDRHCNVRAGTIVDTHITHPTDIDFYLVSHASIQGTARPTKYKCVYNEINMTENQIEELTYHLCHMFARCTRAVSYPAPTYYAHLAAFRARALTQNVEIRLDDLPTEQKKIEILIKSRAPMFFI
ncbi:protein argonaute-2-like [Polistes fuscatus]|uniref:protein argonaute-2-like n=1 Tax=Polistes fuscatus TaxID=30207 RepID=UPI001CA96FEB|nr:protein argonaute-2-like [Polistes fuscatus]